MVLCLGDEHSNGTLHIAVIVYEGKWHLKGLGSHGQVLGGVCHPETDNWFQVYGGMVLGMRHPSVSFNGNLYALDCKDGRMQIQGIR